MVALPNNNDTLSIARALAAVLERLKDLAKTDPTGATGLWDGLAAHVRSASPQSMLKEQPPLTSVKTPIAPDGWYGITTVGGNLVLVVNEGRRDAALTLTPVQVEALVRDVMAVKAGAEVERG